MPSFFKESKTNDFWLEKVIPLEPKHAMSSHVNNTILHWYPDNSKRTKKKVFRKVSPAKLIPLTRKEAVIDHVASTYPNKKTVYSTPNSNLIKKKYISVPEQPEVAKTGSKGKQAMPISVNTTRTRDTLINNYVALDNSYLDKCSKYLEAHQDVYYTKMDFENSKNPENSHELERALYSCNTMSQCGDKLMSCHEKSVSDSGIFVVSDSKAPEHPWIKNLGHSVKKGGEAHKLNLQSESPNDALTKFLLTAKKTEEKYPSPELTVQWLSTWAKCQHRAEGSTKRVKGFENKNNCVKVGVQMEKCPRGRSSLLETEINNYIMNGGCQMSKERLCKVCGIGRQFNCAIRNPCLGCCVWKKNRKKKNGKTDPYPNNCKRAIISCLKGLVKKKSRAKNKTHRKAGCNQSKGCHWLCGVEATCPLGRKKTCHKIAKPDKIYAGMEYEKIEPAPTLIMKGAKQEMIKNYEKVLEGNAEIIMAPDSDEYEYSHQFKSWTNIADKGHNSSLLSTLFSEQPFPYSNEESIIYHTKVPDLSTRCNKQYSDIHVKCPTPSLSHHISEKSHTYSKCNNIICRSKSPDKSSRCNKKRHDIHVKCSNPPLSHHSSTRQISEKPHIYSKNNKPITCQSKSPDLSSRCNKKCNNVHLKCSDPLLSHHISENNAICRSKSPVDSSRCNKKSSDIHVRCTNPSLSNHISEKSLAYSNCNNVICRSKSPFESSRCNEKFSDIHAKFSNLAPSLDLSKQSLPCSEHDHINFQTKLPEKSLLCDKKCNDVRPLIYQSMLSDKSFRYVEDDDILSEKSCHFPFVSYFPISAVTYRAGFAERERNILEENNEQYHNCRVKDGLGGVKKRRSNAEPAAIKVLKELLECVETEIEELEENMEKFKTIGSNWGFEHAMSELRLKQKVLQNQIKKAIKERKSSKVPICPHKDKQIFHFKQSFSHTDSESSVESKHSACDSDVTPSTGRKEDDCCSISSKEGSIIFCTNKTPVVNSMKASSSAQHLCEGKLQSNQSVIGSVCSLSVDKKTSDSDSDCDSENSLNTKSIHWSDCVKYLLSSKGCKVNPVSTLDNYGD